MIEKIYFFILIYFFLGGVGFYIINRKKEKHVARESYIKLAVYFVIINIIFFSIVVEPLVFRILSILIIVAGIKEMSVLALKKPEVKNFSLLSLALFLILACGFFMYSGLPKGLILFVFIVIAIFDSFSQISGQLLGKTKISPKISPNKTLEGTIGGGFFALASVLWLYKLYTASIIDGMFMALGAIFFAFVGDIMASFYKRKFDVKDFSKIIPGHGGFLDRFDSLIAGGAWVVFYVNMLNMPT